MRSNRMIVLIVIRIRLQKPGKCICSSLVLTDRYRYRYSQTDRQTDRQTKVDTKRSIQTEINEWTDRGTFNQTDKQTDTQTTDATQATKTLAKDCRFLPVFAEFHL